MLKVTSKVEMILEDLTIYSYSPKCHVKDMLSLLKVVAYIQDRQPEIGRALVPANSDEQSSFLACCPWRYIDLEDYAKKNTHIVCRFTQFELITVYLVYL